MGPIDGYNSNRVKYFNLEDYVDRIKVSEYNLQFADEIAKSFEKYINMLKNYPDTVILDHLVSSFKREITYSNKAEKHHIDPRDISDNDVYFDSLSISHEGIKKLHKFAYKDDEHVQYDYRKNEARKSWIDHYGEEHIYWYGAEPEDIKNFMDNYINFYKSTGVQARSISPFLKAALCHLLFLRIHPFNDGNSRTSRLLYDMKFTEMINKIYGTKLKISPLHISMSIYNNQPTYSKCVRDIYFDLEHDSNDEINKFLQFLLTMTEEQLNFLSTRDQLSTLNDYYKSYLVRRDNNVLLEKEKEEKVKTMKMNKLFK